MPQVTVTALSLTNFRSYRTNGFSFAPRTVFVGHNGAGKTNLLEALYLLSSTKSFRADKETEMISWGEAAANVTAEITTARPQRVTAKLATGASGRISKGFEVDGNKRRARDMITEFPMVLFSADDTRLIDGAPGRRRRALDLAISQGSREYHDQLATYNRVLSARNRLLEQVAGGEAGQDELDFWDDQLIASGQAVVTTRQDYADAGNKLLSDLYNGIAPSSEKGRLAVDYRPLVEDLSAEIPRRRAQDIAVGTTTAGPHRDDWRLLLGNRALSSFGSGGEYRSAVLAWRMAEQAWLTEHLGMVPALLLDDVFSELDEQRRAALLAMLPEGQTIITTPEADVLPAKFAQDAQVTEIKPPQDAHV